MRALFSLLMNLVLAMLLLATGAAWAQGHDHVAEPVARTIAVAQGTALAANLAAHAACNSHRSSANLMATHGSTPRCKQACLALSAGFSAVLPMQAHALWLVDGASPHPDAHHALPAGRVVMPERRPPKAA